jgi:ribosomal protein L7/L12
MPEFPIGLEVSTMTGAAGDLGCIVLLLVVLAYLLQLQKRVTTLTRVEAKLDLLLRNAGLQYDPYADLPAPVVEALRRGDKIEAIKHFRQTTGAGLKDAKEFIEEAQRRGIPKTAS